MVKWMSRVAGNRGKSLIPSTIITLAIVAMLILSGPAQAVAVAISGLQDTYTKGSDIDFQVTIEINDPDKYVPVTNISLDLTGPINKTIFFDLDGNRISGDCNVEIKPVSIPKPSDFGYGSGYGYDTRTGYGYDFGYGYGYGYGYGGGGAKISFVYNVTIDTDTKCLPAGNYNLVASLNTGKNVAFRSPTSSFELLPVAPGKKIEAKVDIKPETINLASKGKFTAFITLPDGFDVKDIDVGTVVVEGAHAVKSMISKKDGGTLIAKFNTRDLKNVHTGNAVKFTLTGKLFDGTEFEGSDTVKVISQGKDKKDEEECDDCDEHVKEDESDNHIKEHEDESDNHAEDHDHEKVNDNKPDKNKQKKNNNGQGKNGNVVNNNNIYINNNTGTVSVYINNQGSGNDVNLGGNGNNNKQGNGNNKAGSNRGGNGKGKNKEK